MNFDLTAVLIALPVLLLSLTAHEFAHAWVALKQGDDTAYMLGRVTMNPAAHIDVFGTLIFPILAIGAGVPLIGWAKPVPVTPRKYRKYKRGEILVAIAGVCANAVLAVLFALAAAGVAAASGGSATPPEFLNILFVMLVTGVYVNLSLILFNLLPIPPLDGSNVFYHLLPPGLGAEYRRLAPYGFILLYALMFTGVLRALLVLIYPVAGVLLLPAASLGSQELWAMPG